MLMMASRKEEVMKIIFKKIRKMRKVLYLQIVLLRAKKIRIMIHRNKSKIKIVILLNLFL